MTPGSREAISFGCICRKAYMSRCGAGMVFNGGLLYEVFDKCPIHGEKTWKRPTEKGTKNVSTK